MLFGKLVTECVILVALWPKKVVQCCAALVSHRCLMVGLLSSYS
jgi:hypothetical protein